MTDIIAYNYDDCTMEEDEVLFVGLGTTHEWVRWIHPPGPDLGVRLAEIKLGPGEISYQLRTYEGKVGRYDVWS